jgi:hypothetical protein
VFDMLSTLLEDGRFLNEQAAAPTSDEPGRKTSIPIMKRLKVDKQKRDQLTAGQMTD